MNYASLVSDLQTYMLRADQPYLAKIPDLIQQAIIRVYNNVNDIGFELSYAANLVQNTYLVTKPGNWRETISFSVIDVSNNQIFLQERTYEYCKTYLPNIAVRGTPKYYSDIPVSPHDPNSYTTWFVVPSSDANYTVNVIYLGIPLFNAENPTNFLTQRYPALLLYSCLLEASLFLDNEEKRTKYETMFGKELDAVNSMNTNRTTDRTVVREKS